MAAASALFDEHGVAATTMAQIAAAAGLQQSSLYYYFRSKEDVLAAIVARANIVPLQLIRLLTTAPGSPAARLYRFVEGDVAALSAQPFDINEVHRIAARGRQRFTGYWQERRTLQSRLTAIVREGMTSGQFRDVNPRLAAITIMANDEAVQNWYRHDSRPVRDPRAAGRFLADLTVAGLLAGPVSLDTVRREAATLD